MTGFVVHGHICHTARQKRLGERPLIFFYLQSLTDPYTFHVYHIWDEITMPSIVRLTVLDAKPDICWLAKV